MSSVQTTSGATAGWRQYIPHTLITAGGLVMMVNIIMLGVNVGTQDSNQSIRKYVGIAFVPVIVSLIFLGIGLKMYFTQFPAYLPYAAITLALIAVGISNMSVCISLIEKVYS